MFVICMNKLALKIMEKKRNDFVANPIITLRGHLIYWRLIGPEMNNPIGNANALG